MVFRGFKTTKWSRIPSNPAHQEWNIECTTFHTTFLLRILRRALQLSIRSQRQNSSVWWSINISQIRWLSVPTHDAMSQICESALCELFFVRAPLLDSKFTALWQPMEKSVTEALGAVILQEGPPGVPTAKTLPPLPAPSEPPPDGQEGTAMEEKPSGCPVQTGTVFSTQTAFWFYLQTHTHI